MPKKDQEGPTQATDAFEFIGRMAQKRKEKPELEEKEAVEKLMKPNQIAEAQKLAKEWIKEHKNINPS